MKKLLLLAALPLLGACNSQASLTAAIIAKDAGAIIAAIPAACNDISQTTAGLSSAASQVTAANASSSKIIKATNQIASGVALVNNGCASIASNVK